MLKKIGLGFVVVLAVLIGVVATRPAEFKVERHESVLAPAGLPYEQVADFHKWKGWSPWAKLDPNQKETFSGADKGPGAVYEWVGNDQVGQGRMTILSAMPSQLVDIKLEFIKPFASTNQATFTFEGQPGGTKVTWTMAGTFDFFG